MADDGLSPGRRCDRIEIAGEDERRHVGRDGLSVVGGEYAFRPDAAGDNLSGEEMPSEDRLRRGLVDVARCDLLRVLGAENRELHAQADVLGLIAGESKREETLV